VTEYAKLSKSHRAPPAKLEESSRNRAFMLTIQGAIEKIKASTTGESGEKFMLR
jgi:hypothetical protein